jgi:hypothetical protein
MGAWRAEGAALAAGEPARERRRVKQTRRRRNLGFKGDLRRLFSVKARIFTILAERGGQGNRRCVLF